MARRLHIGLLLLPALLGWMAAPSAIAQLNLSSYLSGTNGAYGTNFSSLLTSGTSSWTNQVTHPSLPGWYAAKSVLTTNIRFAAAAGSDTQGGLYSFGTGTSTDRAFGCANSAATGVIAYAVYFYNDSGATLTNFSISYAGEQWRKENNATKQQLLFDYRISSSAIYLNASTSTTWGGTAVPGLTFTNPYAAATAAAALDGNQSSNRQTRSADLAVGVTDGQYVMFRWLDADHSGNDHQMGIDDVSITYQQVSSAAADVAVYGTNVLVADGDVTPSPAEFTDFGAVGANQSNLVRTFTITNSGTAALGVGNVTTSGTHAADFVVISQPSSPISAGAGSTFQVRFDPGAIGLRTGVVQFTNTVAAKSPYDFVVQGTGVAAGIVRGPVSISLTSMVGTSPGNQNIGITNGGRGRLDYSISSNVSWLTVSPVTGQLAETASQQETVSFNVTGLSAGVSNGTITIVSSVASNDGLGVSVALTLTNIPDPTAQSALADGNEMVNLAWTKMPSHNVMIVHQQGSAPADPVQGTSYAVGGSVAGGGTVIYSGAGTNLEHVVRTNATHYYRFFSINNNHYSPGVSSNAATSAYGAGEIVDAVAYTNGVNLSGLNGGNGWTNAWSDDNPGAYTVADVSFSTQTNYPPVAANKIKVTPPSDTGRQAYRYFPGRTGGKVYAGFMINIQYNGPNKYSGLSFMDGSTEKMFFGEVYGGDQKLGVGGTVSGSNLYAGAGNDYVVIARYDFDTDVGSVVAYKIGTDAVPTTEPATWHATYTDGSLGRIDGIRLASGAGSGSGTPGDTYFDEVRVATNWAELLRIVAEPEIALLGTNGAAVSAGDTAPSTADGTDFGSLYFVGATARTNLFAITNSGNAVLNLSGITTSSTMGAASDFTVLSWPTAVQPGTRSNLVIGFNPSDLGLRTALVSIANNDLDEGTYTFAVQGTGTGAYSTITYQGFEGSSSDTWNYRVVSNGTSVYVDGSTNAAGAYAMTLRGSASLNADPYVEFDNVDLSGYAVVTLQVAFAVAGADSGDNLELDLSYDGGTSWGGPGSTTLVSGASNTNLGFTGIGSSTVGANPWAVTLPATAQQVRVRLRFNESVNDNTFDRYFFDDVRLTGLGGPPVVSLGASTYLASEGGGTLTVPVSISYAAAATVRVALAGAALPGGGNDYTANSTNIVFAAAGATTSNLVLTINDDTLAEGIEDIEVRLVNASGAVVGGPALAAILVQDDDAFSVMSANLTAGTNIVDGTYAYDPTAERIIRRLRPDVLAIQEWKFTNASYRAFVDSVLGTNYYYYVEPETDPNPLPNGVISRWPITASNEWADTYVGARDYVQVTIDIPGPRNLHVVSVHFKAGASDAATRENEARELTNYIAAAAFSTSDFLVVAGDLNLTNRTETTFLVLTQRVTDANQPADKDSARNSNIGKTSPYDHVLPNETLDAEHLPVVIGGYVYTNGAIFDSTQFDDHLLPVLVQDSRTTNRTHCAVVKLFNLSTAAVPPTVTTTIASATNQTTATAGGNVTADGGATVTNRGVVWATSASPTVPGAQTTNGTGTGSFSSTLTNLTAGGTYYYRAFAQNSVGTSYGAEYTLTTPCFSGIVTGLYASATNDINFTATWSNFAGATGYALDVSSNATFGGAGGAAGTIVSYEFPAAASLVATTVGGGVTVSVVSLSSGTIETNITTGTYFPNEPYVEETAGWGAASQAAAKYFVFTIYPAGGNSVTITNLSFRAYATSAGPSAFSFDVDGGSAIYTVNAPDSSLVVVDQPVTNVSGRTGPVVVRIQGWDNTSRATSGAGVFRLDDVLVTGTIGSDANFMPGYSNRAVSATSATVTGLTSGVTYYFRVRATNDYCSTASSATSSVTTVLLTPDVAVYGNNTLIADGDATPSPADHTDFGAVGLINSNLVRTFTITNSGAGSLVLGPVTTNGTSAHFVVISQPAGPLAAGSTTNFQVRFDPTALGLVTAEVQFTNNVAGKSPYNFTIQGTGVAAGFVRSPSSISVSAMLGSSPAVQNVGVTNGGLGQLIYAVSTSASWLAVSPVSGTLSESQGQQHSVTLNMTGLVVGVSNATITLTDANASNNNLTISVALTITNIPSVTAAAAVDDGKELVRVSWTKQPSHDVLIVHRATNAPGVPVNGTAYNVGDALGSDGSRVVYKGAGGYLDHVAGVGRTNLYAFYSINNNYYAPAITAAAVTATYGSTERVEAFAYTNGVTLAGLGGGNLFTSTWSIGAGNFTVLSNGPSPNVWIGTNYPAQAAQRVVVSNYVNDTEMRASRRFAAVTNGTLYVTYLMAVEYGGAGKYTGVRLLSNTTERAFAGETGGNDVLGIDGYGGGVVNSAFSINSWQSDTGNVYLVVARYIFSSNQVAVKAYYRTTAVPEAEPTSWDTTAIASSDRTYVDGIELVSGGFSGNQPGLGAFDEVRIATNWAGIVPPSGQPGIGVSPTNITVTVMRGSNPANTSFAVTNVGAGVLAYTVTTNFGWVTVSPVSASLSGGLGQQHTVSLQAAALPVGTNAATITVSDAAATNSPKTVGVTVVVTNIPPPTNVMAVADGNELVRLGWDLPGGLSVLVLHDDAPIATDPSQGVAYTNGDMVGVARVVYRGAGRNAEHVVPAGSTNYYALYCANGDYYSSVATNASVECPDAGATNLVPGDIAIFGMMSLTSGSPPNETNNDSFGFVPLIDLPTGTRIKFTDNGWSNTTFRANEGTLTWEATNCVPAGTAIRWVATNSPPVTVGRMAETNGSFQLNIEGEQILAYQGADTNPVFIYALGAHTNSAAWQAYAVDSHSSGLPPGLTNGYTAMVISELNNVVLNTNQLAITGDRYSVLNFIGNTNNWIGSDTQIFDLLAYNFTFPDVNLTGGGVMTSVVMGVYRTNEIVDAFAYTNSLSLASPERGGGAGWAGSWTNAWGTWTVLSNNHDEVSFPSLPQYPTNAANVAKVDNPGVDNTGRLERAFAAVSTGTVYISTMLAYEYEGTRKFAGISFLSGGAETGFVGKVSDDSYSFTLGIDTYGSARQFANYDLRGLQNSTNNTYLVIARYDFATREIRGHAYYRGVAVPDTEPADWAVTATVSGAGIAAVDGLRIHAGADAGGAVGRAYFDEVRVATSWGQLINRNPPTVLTRAVTNIQPTQAVGGGNVTDQGGLTVTNRGVVWSTNALPTLADARTSDGTGGGLYSSTLTNLTPGETYYVRAFAQNSAGTAYGAVSNFTADCFTSVVIGVYANPTNSLDFTANWSALAGALSYRLDVSTISNFQGASGNYGLEPFTNIQGGTTSSYLTRDWTNNGVAWTSYKSRTDRTINGSEAITFQDAAGAYLVSATISGGVSSLSFKHQRQFGSGSGTVDVFVNAIKVATNVTYGDNVVTTEVTGIDVAGGFVLSITNNTISQRVAIDDLAWTNTAGGASFINGYSARVVTNTSQIVTGLTEGAVYYWRVRAVGAGSCESANSATVRVQTVDTVAPVLSAFGVSGPTNTTITDYQLANAITVTVTATDGGGVNWNGASITAPNISPFFAITNPAGAQIVAPVAFSSAGHVDGESPSLMTGVVTATSVTTGQNFRVNIRVADNTFTNTATYTNFFDVVDDDLLAPTLASADITYGGVGNRYFSITTNASPVLIADRGGTFTNVIYTLTDGELNEAAARDLRIAFGARDAGSGLSRGTSGTTNTVMSFSVEDVIVGNYTNYRSDLSSANYTNSRTTNVWAFPSGFFTEFMITSMMGRASNRVVLTAPDDDSDRAADSLALYDALVGWITVVDDDTAGPVLSGLSIKGLTGAGTTSVWTETMGTSGTSGDSIATHESNNRFDNDSASMSGTGDMRTTTPSSGSDYAEASGSFNVLLNAIGETFVISNIDMSAYANLSLAFGINKNVNAEDGSGLTVEVSSDGTSWTTLTIPALPTGENGWYARTNSAGTIPSATNLHIRFTENNSTQWRIDDVRLIATLSQVQLTDGEVAGGGYAVTSLVQDAFSGVTVSNAFRPYFVLFNTNGLAVVSNGFVTGFADGSTASQVLATNAGVAVSTNLVTLGTNLLRVFATDADNDRSNDRSSSTGSPLAVLVVDDDTNAPAASGFQLAGSTTNFDLGYADVSITGVLADASGIQYGGGMTYLLLLDSSGTVAQSNLLYSGGGSAATGSLLSAGLNCGSDYTVRLYAADADLDRPQDHLAVTSQLMVIHTTGAGGPSDYPTASNLLVNGAAAAPAVELFDSLIRTGGWSLALSIAHPVGVFTNSTSPSFRVTNAAAEVIGATPWSNATQAGTTYYFTNAALPAASFSAVATGLHYVVWSASNQGSCVASILDRSVIASGTNVFTVTDEDTTAPSLSGFALEGGGATLSVALASSGFAITGLVQDAQSGVAFTSQPPYFLFYDVAGGVLASGTVAGGTEGAGTSATALTNWFSGLSLSCGNTYTIRVFAADADADRAGDRAGVTGSVLTVVTEGVSGDAPAAENLLVNNTAASSATLFDETIATGGWKVALTLTHASGQLVTNGPSAPSFLVQNASGTHVYVTSPLLWSNIVKSGANYYATNTPMPPGQTNLVTTGSYAIVWSAQSEGLCFGATNGSGQVSPGTNRFTVVDDDTIPPNMAGLSVAGGTGSGGGPGAGDCPDPTRTNLVAGDIAIFALNTLTTTSKNHDGFAFVALVDIPSGTRIKFTDNGWKSSTASFRNNEGTLTWVATSCVPAGSVVRWITTNQPNVNLGVFTTTNGSFAPNIEGEQILAYQGSDSSPNFIYAMNDRLGGIWDVDAIDSHSSAIPPGLIDGYTCVAVGEFDNVIINTNNLVLTGDREQILYYIGDRDNWIGSDATPYDLLQFNFTFPDVNAGGGTITDQDIRLGGWSITGLVQDVGSGVMVSNGLGLRYVVMNTNDGQVASNYFATAFTNGTRTLQAFSNGVSAGVYAFIQLGTYTAQIYAADVDGDRPGDQAERNTNVPFTVVDDDTDYPQIGYFYINGQTTITNPAELTSVVLSGQVRDVTSGIGFTSAPPTYEILDGAGAVALSGGFTHAPTLEGAGTGWTNIWTTNLNLSGIADCGTYTVRVSIADADDDRPGDRRSTNLFFLINVASGSGAPPSASNLLVNATPAGAATMTDGDIAVGGWSLAIRFQHPSGVRIDAPDTPSFVLRNAAVQGVVTQVWTNITTAGFTVYATNTPMPAIPYGSIDTGYYSVLWSGRSQGACFGETNNSPYIGGDTNRFLVLDDDTAGPTAPTQVVNTASAWTNSTAIRVAWQTNGVTDATGVSHYRVTTNGVEPVALGDGVSAGATNAFVFTNLLEGVQTNWVYGVDADDDRPNDVSMSALTGFVMYVDLTAPTQVTSFAATPGANDNTSEIDLNWGPLPDGGNPDLSPWRTYRIYYTDRATGPSITDNYVSAENGVTALGTNTLSSITLNDFSFDTTYRVAMAGVDRAGNIGPLSFTQAVTLGSFVVTQGLSDVSQNVDISWTAATGKLYDAIYVDARGFGDSLTSQWAHLDSVSDSWIRDTGSPSRVAPLDLSASTMRFYRAALAGKWAVTAQPSRVASREVYAAKPIHLKEGHNLVSFFALPDSNSVAEVFGTNLLPAGPSMVATSTIVSFYGVTTNGQPRAVTWWLSSAGHWMYSTGGIADHAQLPLYEGVSVFIPSGVGTQRLVLVGRVPTTEVVRVIGPGSRSAPVYNVLSCTVPRWLTISELGLKDAGLVGSANPSFADEVRIMTKGWGSPTNQPKARLRLDGNGNWVYLSYSSAEFPSGPPAASQYVVEPDEAIIVLRRNAGYINWTNRLYYSPPNRNMSP